MMHTDLSLSLSVVGEPSKVTGWWESSPKTVLFMTSSERAASIPPLAAEDRVCHRFTCQPPGRESLLSSIVLPITWHTNRHPSAHVNQYRMQRKRDCVQGRVWRQDRCMCVCVVTCLSQTETQTRDRSDGLGQGMMEIPNRKVNPVFTLP